MGWAMGGIVMLVILAVVFGPILLIWALNTLFGLGIAYCLKTWAAAFVLGAIVAARSSK